MKSSVRVTPNRLLSEQIKKELLQSIDVRNNFELKEKGEISFFVRNNNLQKVKYDGESLIDGNVHYFEIPEDVYNNMVMLLTNTIRKYQGKLDYCTLVLQWDYSKEEALFKNFDIFPTYEIHYSRM